MGRKREGRWRAGGWRSRGLRSRLESQGRKRKLGLKLSLKKKQTTMVSLSLDLSGAYTERERERRFERRGRARSSLLATISSLPSLLLFLLSLLLRLSHQAFLPSRLQLPQPSLRSTLLKTVLTNRLESFTQRLTSDFLPSEADDAPARSTSSLRESSTLRRRE